MLEAFNIPFDGVKDVNWQIQLLALATIAIAALAIRGMIVAMRTLKQKLPRISTLYEKAIKPQQNFVKISAYILLLDLCLILIPLRVSIVKDLETLVGLVFSFSLGTVLYRCFKVFFDDYYLIAELNKSHKLNSELLILIKFAVGLGIYIAVVIVFLEFHHINVISLFAGLGIGGLAIAFAAQKTLEQFLGGIVLYIDRPFVVDDYIGLPDGTFGRVESIGWRSTKIRISGKGTVVVVPNTGLTQVAIENFTGAKKMMALVNLVFLQSLHQDERALIQQVIAESTKEIFGLDTRNTDVTFKDNLEDNTTQVQVTFFILGSGELSMDLRVQVLDLANQKIAERLRSYDIQFQSDESTIYVDSPIAI
ncbi:mechanosensitive ion channel family protein [Synechococcus sp. PCC 7336]|uniref:mechanosensitive ion channel family protein n=1 Tax=Synechococcus sp. PCC 7336 TaxID=195250 RepID=UPI0003454C60|nr:mechanosensitive ion channel domain-containing protein [Synechococcus sp. PCC 7336]